MACEEGREQERRKVILSYTAWHIEPSQPFCPESEPWMCKTLIFAKKQPGLADDIDVNVWIKMCDGRCWKLKGGGGSGGSWWPEVVCVCVCVLGWLWGGQGWKGGLIGVQRGGGKGPSPSLLGHCLKDFTKRVIFFSQNPPPHFWVSLYAPAVLSLSFYFSPLLCSAAQNRISLCCWRQIQVFPPNSYFWTGYLFILGLCVNNVHYIFLSINIYVYVYIYISCVNWIDKKWD